MKHLLITAAVLGGLALASARAETSIIDGCATKPIPGTNALQLVDAACASHAEGEPSRIEIAIRDIRRSLSDWADAKDAAPRG